MGLRNILSRLFRNKPDINNAPLTPELIESLPMADDPVFHRDSKRLLQRFDEYITAAEAESEILSIELDNALNQEDILRTQLHHLNKPGSWHERHIFLKIDRLQLHSNNLKQRIEIFSQNIKIYLNLIAKIQDVKAMRLNGLDQEKIETIWLEFKDTLEEYKDRIQHEQAGYQNEQVTSQQQEARIEELRKEIFPTPEPEKEPEPKQTVELEKEPTPLRPPISSLLAAEAEIVDLQDDDLLEDDYYYEDDEQELALE